jgi:NADPH:quinone reductase-like Zn-dependent oxidoreductase
MTRIQSLIPEMFTGVGYTKTRGGFPLEAVPVPVEQPAAGHVLIHVVCSSLNPLEHKLADLNFFGRTPPVALGFDLSGIVVATGKHVTIFAVGDEVMAMADSNGNGGWAVGGQGGYAIARECLTVAKPPTLSFRDAGVLPICFISAFKALHANVRAGDTVYIPGGTGGVGHLAVQMAARALGAALVISSASTPAKMDLTRSFGAHHVFNYKQDDVNAEIMKLTDGRGADLVFDATYSEASFADTAKAVRRDGTWAVLGVGPGKTTRVTETESPVERLLAERGARYVNVNLLSYFSGQAKLDSDAEAAFALAMSTATTWATEGRVVPHVGMTIDSSVDAINTQLQDMKTGQGPTGKVSVTVDEHLASSS